jgi:hypothetical protein
MISERTLVRIGVGAIALHVVDDSFLQPQPGTSATDHLVSGFVPLIGLAVAAVIYPRAACGVARSRGAGDLACSDWEDPSEAANRRSGWPGPALPNTDASRPALGASIMAF